jgi:hypothetical protein
MESIVTTPSEHPQTELSALELLQAENASMRAELQALRESQNQQQQPPHSDTAGTFNLFGLPREIHDAIYELCVVPGIVFIKRPGVARVPRSDMRYQRKPSGPKQRATSSSSAKNSDWKPSASSCRKTSSSSPGHAT